MSKSSTIDRPTTTRPLLERLHALHAATRGDARSAYIALVRNVAQNASHAEDEASAASTIANHGRSLEQFASDVEGLRQIAELSAIADTLPERRQQCAAAQQAAAAWDSETKAFEHGKRGSLRGRSDVSGEMIDAVNREIVQNNEARLAEQQRLNAAHRLAAMALEEAQRAASQLLVLRRQFQHVL